MRGSDLSQLMKIHLFLSCYIEKCDAQLPATVKGFLSVQITTPGEGRVI